MENNKKIYTIISFFTITSLVLVIFITWSLFSDIKNNSGELISAKNSIITLDNQNNETANFKTEYPSYKSNLDRIDNLFVDLNNPVDFIQFLEDSSSASNITSQISSSQGAGQTNQNYAIFQLNSKGAFSDEISFVRKIERGPYLLQINNLTIENVDSVVSTQGKSKPLISQQDYANRNVDATFTIKVYIKK